MAGEVLWNNAVVRRRFCSRSQSRVVKQLTTEPRLLRLRWSPSARLLPLIIKEIDYRLIVHTLPDTRSAKADVLRASLSATAGIVEEAPFGVQWTRELYDQLPA
jgi:hypothetical protein